MKKQVAILLITLSSVLWTGFAHADDLTDKSKILCTIVHITECFADGDCLPGPPENWNVPRFSRVDLDEMTLSTTAASGQSRSTPIERIEREGNNVFFMGAEGGRAFSIVLDQDSGTASVAIALESSVLAAFSVCTPIE